MLDSIIILNYVVLQLSWAILTLLKECWRSKSNIFYIPIMDAGVAMICGAHIDGLPISHLSP